MANEFSILIIITFIVQITLCTFNTEASRTGRRNRSQSQSEDALNSNTGDDNPPMNFDIESFKNQLTSLPPAQMSQLADLFTPGGAFGSIRNGNNVDDKSAEPNEYKLPNRRNNRRPNNADDKSAEPNEYKLPNRRNNRRPNRGSRRNARRRSQRRRANGRRNGGLGAGPGCGNSGSNGGEGIGIGKGHGGGGQGYGSGIGYGSGNGVGFGKGEGFGDGHGVGQGYGSGHGAGTGDGRDFEPGQGYGSGTGLGYAEPGSVGPGEGGAGGSMFGYNSREPYDYDDSPASPNVSGTSGAMIGGGSEISGVKINSFAGPARNRIPPRMASGQDRGRRNAFPIRPKDRGILPFYA